MRFSYENGGRPLEGYTIQRPIGHGGFGEVYSAKSDAGKEVALKLVQRSLEVELRGINHCLNLKNPNLLTIFDMHTTESGEHWVVMELMDGDSLAEVVDAHPTGLSQEETMRWLEGICGAVEHLHQCGIVHRDLKPANIFQDSGMVKVGDYGLSKYITASRRSAQTQSVGTVHYMAPEVGSGRYGREVDVYAIGIMLYEMITGNVPFVGESAAEVLMKHLTAKPDVSRLPIPFRAVVARMLAKRPEERYGSPAAVIADIKARLSDSHLNETTDGEDLAVPQDVYAGAPDGYNVDNGEYSGLPPAYSMSGDSPHQLTASLREHPVLWSLCVFLTTIPISLAVMWSQWNAPQQTFASDFAEFIAHGGFLPISAGMALIFASWIFLWRAVAPTPAILSDSRRRANRARQAAQTSRSPARTILAMLLALFVSSGAGCLAGVIACEGMRIDEELSVGVGFAVGLLTFGTVSYFIVSSMSSSLWFRQFFALAAGAGIGCLAGVISSEGMRLADEMAVTVGIGVGLISAGVLGSVLYMTWSDSSRMDAANAPPSPDVASSSWIGGLKTMSLSESDCKIGGVCGGLGQHTPIPSWVWRVLFVALAFATGVGIVLYLGLWMSMPTRQYA